MISLEGALVSEGRAEPSLELCSGCVAGTRPRAAQNVLALDGTLARRYRSESRPRAASGVLALNGSLDGIATEVPVPDAIAAIGGGI